MLIKKLSLCLTIFDLCLHNQIYFIRIMIAETKDSKSAEELARLKAERRKNRKLNELKAFHINITPEKYKGMKFLGNYRPEKIGSELKDPRLMSMPPQIFLNKSVLDVGCGDGSLAIQIAIRMMPKEIVALDIDAQMLVLAKKRVDRIVQNSQKYKAVAQNQQIQKTLTQFPLFFQEAAKKLCNKKYLNLQNFVQIVPENLKIEQQFPRNIRFLNENFLNLHNSTQYDTIICVGTVKWVHLALGDTGLQQFLNKIFDVLKPGGILALEYSYYKSYKQKKGINELFKKNFKDNIKIDPITFPSLLKFIGFEQVFEGGQNQNTVLKHPLQFFRKVLRDDTNSQKMI